MSLLVGALVLAVIAAIWVVHPLVFRRWGLLGDAVPGEVLDREARKRVALAALKDVEYDRAAGKLDDEDYQDIRSRLELEALQAVRAVESAPAPSGAPGGEHVCGFTNPAGSRFCAGCGQRLN